MQGGVCCMICRRWWLSAAATPDFTSIFVSLTESEPFGVLNVQFVVASMLNCVYFKCAFVVDVHPASFYPNPPGDSWDILLTVKHTQAKTKTIFVLRRSAVGDDVVDNFHFESKRFFYTNKKVFITVFLRQTLCWCPHTHTHTHTRSSHHVERLLRAPADQIISWLMSPARCAVLQEVWR